MGKIKRTSTGTSKLLEPEHLVGRMPGVSLRLSERYVSAQHAMIRWTGEHWELKDLGSRNGTFVQSVRVRPGAEQALRAGMKVAFGKIDEEWELVDDSPAVVMAVAIDEGEPVPVENDFIVLPSGIDPKATIYRSPDGTWLLEQPNDSTAPITNLQTFDVAGRTFRFCCPDSICRTSLAESPTALEILNLELSFSVSSDEEHVEIRASSAGRVVELGARNHNYLLLTLARQRLADAAEGFPETSCGWVYQEDILQDASQLNLEVFRIRKHFASHGIDDAANVIERRPRTRQLRIAVPRLSIVRL